MLRALTGDGWKEKSDESLLALITESGLPPEEKARAVLAMRERRVAETHSRVILVLTILVALATLVQAGSAAVGAFSIFTSPSKIKAAAVNTVNAPSVSTKLRRSPK